MALKFGAAAFRVAINAEYKVGLVQPYILEKGGPYMWFLAEDSTTAAATSGGIEPFDIIMLLFTVIIFIGFVRLLMARPKKNVFAIGFTFVSLVLFLVVDFIMITQTW